MIAPLGTPAMAIDELITMRKEPWFKERMRRIRRHLERVRFRDRPILDEPMSIAAIDAVLKEAWFKVQKPGYESIRAVALQ